MNKTQFAIREAAKRYRFECPWVIPTSTSDGRPLGEPYIARVNRRGYPIISCRIRSLDISMQLQVHQLVAYQRYGEAIFSPNVVCRHLNNIKTDFAQDNIALGSHRDNYLDNGQDVKDSMRSAMQQAAKRRCKLTEEQVKSIRHEVTNGASITCLAETYGVSYNTIRYLVNRFTYRDVL